MHSQHAASLHRLEMYTACCLPCGASRCTWQARRVGGTRPCKVLHAYKRHSTTANSNSANSNDLAADQTPGSLPYGGVPVERTVKLSVSSERVSVLSSSSCIACGLLFWDRHLSLCLLKRFMPALGPSRASAPRLTPRACMRVTSSSPVQSSPVQSSPCWGFVRTVHSPPRPLQATHSAYASSSVPLQYLGELKQLSCHGLEFLPRGMHPVMLGCARCAGVGPWDQCAAASTAPVQPAPVQSSK
jgi:hypothetical protein